MIDNEINTFGEGVDEGGLRNSVQIKILIEYITNSFKNPVTSDTVVEALSSDNIANYFDVSEALSELIENGSLECDEDHNLRLTAKGMVSLRELTSDLPASVKEAGVAAVAGIQLKQRNAGSNEAVIVKSGEGYNVICTVLHNGSPVMSLTLYTADYEQAHIVKEKFLDDPAKVYSVVVAAIYG